MPTEINTVKTVKRISCHTIPPTTKENIQPKSNTQDIQDIQDTHDNIFSWYNGNKNYVVVCCVSYDEDYDCDNGETILESKCYRYEYYDVPAKSIEDAVRFVKKNFPKYLKNNLPYTFYRDKKNVKLYSIDEVFVQTIHDREYVDKN